MNIKTDYSGLEIAVIGMAGRFPGADDVGTFWRNLVNGTETITFFTDEELIKSGVDPELLSKPNFVKAKGVFPGLERFDAEFFNYTPRDASLLDPQVRALHEEVYHALEDAGYASEDTHQTIGLFLGATGNFVWELETIKATLESGGHRFATSQLNDKDFAATRIAYSLNLQGPSVTVHSACSTSLYAIDMACRQILTGACSLAVAGGSGLTLPSHNGYLYQEGMINSPDGHCRPFDQDAKGTVEGNGLGVVVLKLLEDAQRDRDHIYAVIKGTAANNDGNRKVGFTAPSVEGQAEVINRALIMADVSAESISYIEAHGTGTNLGDPIEVAGLKKAFHALAPGSCGIGSLKASVGHLDVAAGISSFIKTALALDHKVLPASLNFSVPNPELDLDNSPFYVVTETKPWERKRVDDFGELYDPLRAGVSSFGIGGTNVHVILEEAPQPEASGAGRDWKVLCLSAHTDTALQRMKENYLAYLKSSVGAVNPSDLAWSLQTRQRNLAKRFTLPYQGLEDLIQGLEAELEHSNQSHGQRATASAKPNVYFLFPGQGSQYPGMGKDLYTSEPVFRAELEACLKLVEEEGNAVLRQVLLNPVEGDEERLKETDLSQLALFAVEYAMARLLMSWGIQPSGLIGHSLGEYTAAYLSGVFTLQEAIRLVAARGSLMKSMPRGSMLSVNASADVVEPLLTEELSLAAVNSTSQCTVAGPYEAIEAFVETCAAHQVSTRRLQTTHAFHSSLMEGAMEPFVQSFGGLELKEPQMRYVSNLTGDWITGQEAVNPAYYADHLRGCVQFQKGIETILADEKAVLIEVGPGRTLTTFARQVAAGRPVGVVNTIHHPQHSLSDDAFLAESIGKMWSLGVKLDWKAYYQGQDRNRIPLPLYPFDLTPFPIGGSAQIPGVLPEAMQQVAAAQQVVVSHEEAEVPGGQDLVAGQILWESTLLPLNNPEQKRTCVVLTDAKADAEMLLGELRGWRSLIAKNGNRYLYEGTLGSSIRHANAMDLQLLIQDLRNQALLPNTILVMQSTVQRTEEELRALVHALSMEWKDHQPDVVVFSPVSPISRHPGLVALVRGLTAQHPKLRLHLLDAGSPLQGHPSAAMWASVLKRELAAETRCPVVSYVDGLRFVPKFRTIEVESSDSGAPETDEHLLVLSHEEKLSKTLALSEGLGKSLGAKVSVLPYRIDAPSFDGKTIARVVEELRLKQEQYLTRHSIENQTEAHRLVDEFAARLTYEYVNSLFALEPGRAFTKQELVGGLGVTSSLERYVDYFLQIFCEDDLAVYSQEEARYTVTENVQLLRDAALIRTDIERLTPLFTGQLDLMEHCFRHFEPALRGDIPSLSVLYPTEEGKQDLLLQSYKDSIQEKEDDFLKEVFSMLLMKIVGKKKKIRILEAGGGYGAILRKVAPLLKGIEVEYYFTDLGNTYLESFRQHALQEEMDFMHFGRFDITKRPEEQGLDPASFDIVFAYNVVHATESIGKSLRNMQDLLKPGAILCVLERTRSRRYVDLVWGLADGWWHFDKAERELSPLISVEEWECHFNELGLLGTTAYPNQAELRDHLDVGVIFGQMPPKREVSAVGTGISEVQGHPRVLPAIVAPDETSLESAIGHALRNVTGLKGIVLWDEMSSGERGFDSIVPREWHEVQVAERVNRVAVQFGSVVSVPVVVVSAFAKSGRWDAKLTAWAVAHAKLDAAVASYRLYLPFTDDVMTAGTPQVIKAMLASGIKQLSLNPGNHPFLAVKPIKSAAAEEKNTSEFKDLELLIRNMWSNLFGTEQIDIDADFFDIGGDSFKLIQMTSQLEREGYKVLMNELYNYPTIRSLARYLYDDSHQINRISTKEDLEARLLELTGVRCRLVTAEEEDAVNVLFMDIGTSPQEFEAVRKQLRSHGIPAELLPHYLLPLAKDQELPERLGREDLLKLGFLSDSEKAVLENAQQKLEQERGVFEKAILSQPVTKRYGLTNMQRMHFRGKTSLQLYLIEFNEMVDMETLEQAFCDLVGSHGLLRSSLEKRLWSYRWKEYAPPQKTPLPVMDLSGLTPEAQGRAMEWLAKEEWSADFKGSGTPMYHVKLIKMNEQRYDLLFQFDHSIFDMSSGQVIRHQLLQRYRDLKKGVKRAMDVSTNYEEYLEQIKRGPVGIEPHELAVKFDLERYGNYMDLVKREINRRQQDRIQTLHCEVDLSAFDFTEDDENGPYEIALQIYVLVAARMLNVDAVPFVLISQKRRYAGKNFSDVVGLVLDALPMLIPVDREHPSRMTALVRERMELINNHNVNFVNLVRNLPTMLRWGKLFKKTKEGHSTMQSPLLMNYAGNAETEYGKIWEYSLNQLEDEDQAKLDYGDFYGLVKGQKDKLEFLILCKFESDMELVRKIFDMEMAHLIKAHAKKGAEE